MNGEANLRRPTSVPVLSESAFDEFAAADGGVSLFEHYLQVARNHKLLIAAIILGSLIVGLITALLSEERFRATTRIEISQTQDNVTQVRGVQADDIRQDRLYLPTQYELLRTKSLAGRVVRELNLGQDQQFLASYGIELGADANVEERLAPVLLGSVTIAPVQSSSLVDIQVTGRDREVTAKLANAWADQFIAENLDRRYGATIEARQFLEERLAQTRERLEDAEKQLITYASNRGLLTVEQPNTAGDSQGTVAQTLVASDLQALNEALARATADRISAEAAVAAGSTSDTSNTSSTVSALRQRRAEANAQLAELSSRFGDGYPPVIALKAQVAQLDTEIENEQGRSVTLGRSAYQESLGREQRLRARVNELRGEFVTQRQDSVQYNILQRDVDTNRELYAGLLQRYREIGVVGAGESNVLVVDRASVPGAPYEPNLIKNLLVSFFLGLVLTALVLFVLEQFNQSLRDPREVQDRLGLPLLAGIPRTTEKDLMEDITRSFSELYESYFSLTSTLAFRSGGTVPKSIMVTSSRPGEGKSLSAVALAYLLGRQGKRVLLIDGDLRHSGMGKYLQADGKMGVSQYLQGNEDWRSMLTSPAPLEGFDLLGPGRKSMAVARSCSIWWKPNTTTSLSMVRRYLAWQMPRLSLRRCRAC
jgi:polysaccharide biosynthesis transport protein